jgi:hypothetical protein
VAALAPSTILQKQRLCRVLRSARDGTKTPNTRVNRENAKLPRVR